METTANSGEKIVPQIIEEEMKKSYLDYAMSVIVGRALPDVRDGLKPVHRRILFAMNELGMHHDKSFKKCARIVGEVLGKYHPHGDSSVYDSLVRMAQPFSLRYPLIDGHGNFGSLDGDSAAAMRYTEARLKKLAEDLLVDIDKDTVDFRENFDGSLKEPSVLPTKVPNLLINGSSGIAVGMATNIPPHNLREVCSAAIFLLSNPESSFEDLFRFVKGPDFPTGAVVVGDGGIRQAYASGHGRVVLRGVVDTQPSRLVIREVPYMVNKAQLIEQVAGLVKSKRVVGIRTIRDESDRDGVRVVIELKPGADSGLVVNQLFKYSRLQITFGITFLALVDGQPKVLPLKSLLQEFLNHRRVVVRRRTQFNLDKAEQRAHVLEGLLIALDDVDRVVQGIRHSQDIVSAKNFLMSEYDLTDVQAKAILEMRLQKLASLEVIKTREEYGSLQKLIRELKDVLASEVKVSEIIRYELLDVSERYGDDRRTKIVESEGDVFDEELLIEEKDVVVTLTRAGYVKRLALEEYREQGRGGKGVIAASMREEDVVRDVFVTSTHSYLLCFTNKGNVHWLKAYHVPEASRVACGKPIVNLLSLKGETVSEIIPVREFSDKFVVMVTKKGTIKKTSLKAFSNPRRGGIRAVSLDGDVLIGVSVTTGSDELILATRKGLAVRFRESDVRPMGRAAAGVRGISLSSGDVVVGLAVAEVNHMVLSVTEKGFGKRTKVVDYRLISRGGKGVQNMRLSDKTGDIVFVSTVSGSESLICVTRKGKVIRVPVSTISVFGRATQGVKIMRLDEDDVVVSAEVVVNGSDSSV